MDSGVGHSRDRISNLPDEVRCHILSFLPTKFAVGTCILSERWRYLWASIPNFDFDEVDFDGRGRDEESIFAKTSQCFVNFVNGVLLLSNVSDIKKFRLRLHLHCCETIVHTWICTAIKRNVQELCLHNMEVPLMIFTSKTLVFLELSLIMIPDLPASFWLQTLKVLHLNSVSSYTFNAANDLFIGCPILEEFVMERLENWGDTCDLKVSSPSLKSLTINFPEHAPESHDCECRLQVDSPNLEYLSLSDFGSDNYLVKNLSSLFKAYINVGQIGESFVGHKKYGGRMYKLLRGISSVMSLSLSDKTLYSLSGADDRTLPTFHNLTHLELGVSGDFSWKFLADFLKSSPNLIVLVLEKGAMSIDLAKHWNQPQHVPHCLASCLKEIEIKEFNAEAYNFEVIEYLLKNAKVLKKMAIHCQDFYLEEQLDVFKKLSSFLRGSKSCKLSVLF